MDTTSLVMFSEYNDLHSTFSTQTTHQGQDLRQCLRFQTFWMLQVIFLFFFFCLNFISIHHHTEKQKKNWDIWYKKLTTTYTPMSSIHKMRTSICNTLGLQKVFCPYKGLLSEENDWNFESEGKWLRKQGSCFNKVLMWRDTTILCDPCGTYQTRYLFWRGFLCSCVMFLIFYSLLFQTQDIIMFWLISLGHFTVAC